MTTLRRSVFGVLVLCLLVQSSASWQLKQGEVYKPIRRLQHPAASARRVEGTLSRVARQLSSRAAIVAQDVEDSAARLKVFSRKSTDLPSDDRSPISAVPGSYAMNIELGTPAQNFSAIADTGSDLIWVQCNPCSRCFSQPDPLFYPTKSSSYKTVSCSNEFCQGLGQQGSCSSSNVCKYEYSYGDKSTTTGSLSTETISLNGNGIQKLTFGCGTANQGTFQKVDGLVGLGLGPLSLPSQLSSSLGANKFSYCLPANTESTGAPGAIVFGASASPSTPVKYTSLVANKYNPTFYYVTLNDISVGGKQLNIPSSVFAISPSDGSGGILFDSGTTITQLASAGYAPLKKALQAAITYPPADGSQVGLDLCYDVSGESQPSFPAVTFNFDNADFALPSSNTFVPVDEQGQTVCLAMASSDFGLSIFGNIQQQSFQVVYDVDNSRLGWAAAQC